MGQVIGMSREKIVDTDVLIDFLRGNEKAVTLIDQISSQIILSPIVVAELYAGVKGDNEMSVLDNFISVFRIVPIDSEIAKTGGIYKRDFGKSHGIGLADALLAATAYQENAEIITLNIKHYPMITDLKPAYHK